MNERRRHIYAYLNTLKSVLDSLPVDAIERVLDVLEKAYRADKTIFICGNGGSAATASHWTCDFAKGTVAPGAKRLRMICLNDSVTTLTAYANDVSYDQVFAEPLRTFAKAGDAIVLLTASGNSPSILEAARAARELGVTSIGLIGFGGGKLASLVDHAVIVPCREYGPVEDLHMILDHVISLHLRAIIAGGQGTCE
ncbi:SIS domain-containing protein [bacterium]|nr:SIS domain-containing protein [bacterium]MBU1985430.1 SIS domain-containing protein [bacterium]